MTVLTENIVLGFHHAGQGAHQDAALTGQVAVDLMLEGGGEQIAGSDGNTQGQGSFFGISRKILEHGITGIDTAAV